MKQTLSTFCICCLLTFVSCTTSQNDPTEKRIDELLSKMTLEEKIGQMNQLTGEGLSEDRKESIRKGHIGSMLNEMDPSVVNELQRVAVEESRLGIPLIIARDVIHGFKTIFPIPLGQAASWNPKVAEIGGRFASIEATAVGIRWTFTPMIDVTRDPRWGRVAESCGEDPFLTSIMGAAMIKGIQGDDLSDSKSMAACAKHFAAYGASEAGKDYNTTWVPETQLRDIYLPPFKAAIEAGAATFMCSFNDINGIPSSGNKYLNDNILRKEWGFDGVLVSDWGSIEQMIPHGYSTDLKAAAESSLNAKVDIDMMSHAYVKHTEELIKEGKISEKQIDEMVRNILRLKFRLGLFENPYARNNSMAEARKEFYTGEALDAARLAAIESVILIKNNDNTLPVKSGKKVAIVGPLADSGADQVGTWCFDVEPEYSITPLKAIVDQYSKTNTILSEIGLKYSRDKNFAGITAAVNTAKKADVILYFAGEESVLSGEARCRADISLPGAQTEMLKALKATGKPVVMIVMAGRPLTIEKELEMADAVLYSFHAGTMAGPALADLIFGKAVPSGKLPITIPRMVGQVPIYYAHKTTGRPAKDITLIDDIPVGALQTSIGFTSYHLDAGDSPLLPFGYGLSYTTFEYSDVKLSSTKIGKKQNITATCSIKNVGDTEGEEVVQLYIRDLFASLVRPVKELKGFEKISLAPGEEKEVSFTITVDDLAFWHDDKTKRAEEGEFHLWIAPNSQVGTPVSFTY